MESLICPGPGSSSGSTKLITGYEQRDARPPSDLDRRHSHGAQQSQLAGTELDSFGNENLTGVEIVTCGSHVLTLLHGALDEHLAVFLLGDLDHDDRVRTLRKRGSGHDASGGPGRDDDIAGAPRANLSNDLELHR